MKIHFFPLVIQNEITVHLKNLYVRQGDAHQNTQHCSMALSAYSHSVTSCDQQSLKADERQTVRRMKVDFKRSSHQGFSNCI